MWEMIKAKGEKSRLSVLQEEKKGEEVEEEEAE